MPSSTSFTRTPVRAATIDVRRHSFAHEVLQDVGEELKAREGEANVILPLLLKRIKSPSPSSSSSSTSPEFWLVVRSRGSVDFVLSCTNGPMGTYPIFIWCGRPIRTMSNDFIRERMNILAVRLLEALRHSPRRVYSVFGMSFTSLLSRSESRR